MTTKQLLIIVAKTSAIGTLFGIFGLPLYFFLVVLIGSNLDTGAIKQVSDLLFAFLYFFPIPIILFVLPMIAVFTLGGIVVGFIGALIGEYRWLNGIADAIIGAIIYINIIMNFIFKPMIKNTYSFSANFVVYYLPFSLFIATMIFLGMYTYKNMLKIQPNDTDDEQESR